MMCVWQILTFPLCLFIWDALQKKLSRASNLFRILFTERVEEAWSDCGIRVLVYDKHITMTAIHQLVNYLHTTKNTELETMVSLTMLSSIDQSPSLHDTWLAPAYVAHLRVTKDMNQMEEALARIPKRQLSWFISNVAEFMPERHRPRLIAITEELFVEVR